MINERKILNILLILLIFFVGFLVLRLVLTDLAIKDHEQYLTNLISGSSSESQLSAPVIRTSDPFKGAREPQVTIVAFESFSCSYCAQMSSVLEELLDKYSNKVKLIWKDFVNSSDQRGLRAAVAARCAQSQGKFWEFHDALFANQINLSDSYYKEVALNLSLDQDRFNNCFANQETLALVQNSFNEGLALGLDGTPYLFVNNQRISGLISFTELEKIVNE